MKLCNGGVKMSKKYIIWWHSKYVDEIDRDATTIRGILNSASETLRELEKLGTLEDAGKIKIEDTGALNPIHLKILDESIESEVANNPIVEVEE